MDMVQALLAERVKLHAHEEMQERDFIEIGIRDSGLAISDSDGITIAVSGYVSC
jgi:hypothetical protein